jgi:ribosomal protein S18 acetylase RimI-like enzyme
MLSLSEQEGIQTRDLDHAPDHSNLGKVRNQLAYAITPAGPGDAPGLARVHVRSWRETYAGLLPQAYLDRMSVPIHARRWAMRLMRTGEVTLVAEGADGPVGYCSGERTRWRIEGAETSEHEGEITTLYVLKSAQGEGLGHALMMATARTLQAQGATSLIIWVLRDNVKARSFYEGWGGLLVGERIEQVGGCSAPSVAYRWADLKAWVGNRNS